MTVAYAYRDHSGSLASGQIGYEVTAAFPASAFFNFGYDFPEGGGSGICYYQPEHRLGDYSPHSFRGSSSLLKIQYFDSTRGWTNLRNLIDFQGAYQPTSTLGYLGTTSSAVGFDMNPANPPRFRIAYASEPGQPAVSWSRLNVGVSDTCWSPVPTAPEVHIGYAETTLFIDASAFRRSVDSLPNGAPLAGRNRVQVIS